MTALGHPEVEELLGAYALDALEPEEADAVDLHLRDCPRCRAEVGEYREAAALLAFGGVEAPPGVWEKIQASLEEAPPPVSLGRVVPITRASRWQSMGARVAAAAAVVISVLALGISLVRGGGSSDDDRTLNDEIAVAAADPDAVPVHLASASTSGGGGAADIVILDGRAYLIRHSLPALADDETYQLWGKKGDTLVSLGVLGPSPSKTILPAGASYEALAITAEKAPGVVSSQNPAVVAGLVPVD
jgi:hypothetical protein